jgi:nucleoside-diphosphate-sugar epimerase
MSRIAILGASSQIAKDLILSFAQRAQSDLLLYVRDCAAMQHWLASHGLVHSVFSYAEYGRDDHDAVLNFVGVGDPQRAAQMGGEIFSVTQKFDDLVLDDLKNHPQRRYVFMSSGAAYGSAFLEPVGPNTRASIAINALVPQEYYSVAKLHAESKHRALDDRAITDIRLFNYFSRTQDMNSRFFITDILRAIRDGETLQTSSDYMARDFLHPADFCRLVDCILAAPAGNRVIDCYTRAPIDKPALLSAMQQKFGLKYQMVEGGAAVNATGGKPYYYSLNRQAAELGYQPAYSSQDGVILESTYVLNGMAA